MHRIIRKLVSGGQTGVDRAALDESADPRKVIDWVKQSGIDVLNVAGPREDRHLNIHEQATDFLRNVLQYPHEIMQPVRGTLS